MLGSSLQFLLCAAQVTPLTTSEEEEETKEGREVNQTQVRFATIHRALLKQRCRGASIDKSVYKHDSQCCCVAFTIDSTNDFSPQFLASIRAPCNKKCKKITTKAALGFAWIYFVTTHRVAVLLYTKWQCWKSKEHIWKHHEQVETRFWLNEP